MFLGDVLRVNKFFFVIQRLSPRHWTDFSVRITRYVFHMCFHKFSVEFFSPKKKKRENWKLLILRYSHPVEMAVELCQAVDVTVFYLFLVFKWENWEDMEFLRTEICFHIKWSKNMILQLKSFNNYSMEFYQNLLSFYIWKNIKIEG